MPIPVPGRGISGIIALIILQKIFSENWYAGRMASYIIKKQCYFELTN
jgi:hypothetical protein